MASKSELKNLLTEILGEMDVAPASPSGKKDAAVPTVAVKNGNIVVTCPLSDIGPDVGHTSSTGKSIVKATTSEKVSFTVKGRDYSYRVQCNILDPLPRK